MCLCFCINDTETIVKVVTMEMKKIQKEGARNRAMEIASRLPYLPGRKGGRAMKRNCIKCLSKSVIYDL